MDEMRKRITRIYNLYYEDLIFTGTIDIGLRQKLRKYRNWATVEQVIRKDVKEPLAHKNIFKKELL